MRHPLVLTSGPPRLRELLPEGAVERTKLASLLDTSQREAAGALAALGDEVVVEDGQVRLADTEPKRERQRRGPSPEALIRRAERQAQIAEADPGVQAFREQALSGELLDWPSAPRWIEEQAQQGERVELVTRDGSGRVVRREHPTLAYAGPDDEYVRRVACSSALDPLRRLSDRLAGQFGWQPAQAVAFVLTGLSPLTGRRVTTRLTFGRGWTSEHAEVGGDLSDDPEGFAQTMRQARSRRGISRARTDRDAERLVALREHAAQYGPGAASWRRWNSEQRADWHYADRRSFRRAANRAA